MTTHLELNPDDRQRMGDRLVDLILEHITIHVDIDLDGEHPGRVTTYTCPECGKDDIASLGGLAGHRFHKHGIRTSEEAAA